MWDCPVFQPCLIRQCLSVSKGTKLFLFLFISFFLKLFVRKFNYYFYSYLLSLFFYSVYSYLLRPLCHKLLMRVETLTRDRQTDRELLTSVFSFWNFGDRGNRWMITRPVDVGEALWISVTVTTFPGLLFLFPRLLLSPVMYLWQRNCQWRLSVYTHSKGVEVPFILRAFYDRPQLSVDIYRCQ